MCVYNQLYNYKMLLLLAKEIGQNAHEIKTDHHADTLSSKSSPIPSMGLLPDT